MFKRRTTGKGYYSKPDPSYKILTREDGKFCAMFDDRTVHGDDPKWRAIKPENSLAIGEWEVNDKMSRICELWVDTEEIAGQRVNRHASKDGTTTVWSG
jgi:hypothetical protein